MNRHCSQFDPPAADAVDGAPVYPFATILRPGRRNHSRGPIQWVRWFGLAVSLFGLAMAIYSC